MAFAWVFVVCGLAVTLCSRRLADAAVALDRRIAQIVRVPAVRRRAYAPWRAGYTRFALVFVGLMWAGIGALTLLLTG